MPGEIVEKLKAGTVPPAVVTLIARGAFPLPLEDKVEALLHLLNDSNEETRTMAGGTLEQIPESSVLSILTTPGTDISVMYFYADVAERMGKQQYLEAIVQNPTTPDEYIAFLATRLPPNLLDVIATNQVRLIRHPQIMDSIEMNPQVGRDILRRVKEVREEFFLKKMAAERAPTPAGPAALVKYGDRGVTVAPGAVKGEALARVLPAEIIATLEPHEQAEGLSPERISTYQKLLKMTVPERIQAALKGSKEERTALIKDPNRIVIEAVLASPKLSEPEVETYSTMRNLSEDVIRRIASNRDWIKNHKIVLNLVNNPKTPIAISLAFLNRLHEREVHKLSRDKNVPDVIRKAAGRLMLTRRDRG
ncbi:MAG: hypothetical protein HYX75_19075 [Acidobacteria bacterium]|nr:hypothetical protein [Acidobacteriota bacterium]